MLRGRPLRNRAGSGLRRLARDCRGGTAVEYAFILALITVFMVAALIKVADVTINMWGDVSGKVQEAR